MKNLAAAENTFSMSTCGKGSKNHIIRIKSLRRIEATKFLGCVNDYSW